MKALHLFFGTHFAHFLLILDKYFLHCKKKVAIHFERRLWANRSSYRQSEAGNGFLYSNCSLGSLFGLFEALEQVFIEGFMSRVKDFWTFWNFVTQICHTKPLMESNPSVIKSRKGYPVCSLSWNFQIRPLFGDPTNHSVTIGAQSERPAFFCNGGSILLQQH